MWKRLLIVTAVSAAMSSMAMAAPLTVGFSQVGSESGWRAAETNVAKSEAEKRGITVSEYLRQSVNSKMSRERPMDWHPTVAKLEEICAGADGETRAALIDLIRSLYKGGA